VLLLHSLNFVFVGAFDLERYIPETNDIYLATMRLEVDFLAKNKKVTEKYEVDDIKKSIITQLEQQISFLNQREECIYSTLSYTSYFGASTLFNSFSLFFFLFFPFLLFFLSFSLFFFSLSSPLFF
jgi:hypothetical protein